MPQILLSLFFAGATTASITTSIWMSRIALDPFANETIAYRGSVVGAAGDRTTLALLPDQEIWTGIEIVATDIPLTVTVGPKLFETGEDDPKLSVRMVCERSKTEDEVAECSRSWNGEFPHSYQCSSSSELIGERFRSFFASTGTDGEVETISRIRTHGEEVVPEWCTTDTMLPESAATTAFPVPVEAYQVIVTAGEEKLSATAGASITGSGATATQSQGTASTAEPTGGAAMMAPMSMSLSALAGLVVAAVPFFS